jgi:tetratricopeptide (TPR) repeat protein
MFAAALGVLAAGVSLWWLPRCVREERASLLYKEARYGPSSNNVFRVLSLAERAYAIDPAQYHFWATAADGAWSARFAPGGAARDAELRDSAARWCRRTLDANPWHPKARVLRAAMLAEIDPQEALRYWRHCVDWQYWEPFNHAFLAELHGRCGDFAQAAAVLEGIRGMSYYEETRAILDRMARQAR